MSRRKRNSDDVSTTNVAELPRANSSNNLLSRSKRKSRRVIKSKLGVGSKLASPRSHECESGAKSSPVRPLNTARESFKEQESICPVRSKTFSTSDSAFVPSKKEDLTFGFMSAIEDDGGHSLDEVRSIFLVFHVYSLD